MKYIFSSISLFFIVAVAYSIVSFLYLPPFLWLVATSLLLAGMSIIATRSAKKDVELKIADALDHRRDELLKSAASQGLPELPPDKIMNAIVGEISAATARLNELSDGAPSNEVASDRHEEIETLYEKIGQLTHKYRLADVNRRIQTDELQTINRSEVHSKNNSWLIKLLIDRGTVDVRDLPWWSMSNFTKLALTLILFAASVHISYDTYTRHSVQSKALTYRTAALAEMQSTLAEGKLMEFVRQADSFISAPDPWISQKVPNGTDPRNEVVAQARKEAVDMLLNIAAIDGDTNAAAEALHLLETRGSK